MKKLREYLNSLQKEQRAIFVAACGTSEGYLRKAISMGQRLGPDLCIPIERESCGAITCEDIRPDIDWAFLRQTKNLPPKIFSSSSPCGLAMEAASPNR